MLNCLANPGLTSLHRAAVVIPTLLRPSLVRAMQSIFGQKIDGSLQILIGIDAHGGDPAILAGIAGLCPAHVRIDVLDPGYPTSTWRGGVYPARAGGALRTAMSFLAHSRQVAYLDDDNWWAPDHLASLCAAIEGVDWAYSQRWFVEEETEEPICVDEWESVGPDAGLYGEEMGGFVDTSSLMLDKLKCFDALPLWCGAAYENGTGEDRLVFKALKTRPHRATGQPTSYYIAQASDAMNTVRHQQIRERGIVLPSQRQTGVTTLAEAAEPYRVPYYAAAEPMRETAPDPLLSALMAQLKPREVISFAGGNPATAGDIAATAAAAGLKPLIAVIGAPAEFAGGPDLLPLPRSDTLGGFKLAVDLIHIGERPLPDLKSLLTANWPQLRAGGVVLGDGNAVPGTALNAMLTTFSAASNAELLPASMDGVHRWILQKG